MKGRQDYWDRKHGQVRLATRGPNGREAGESKRHARQSGNECVLGSVYILVV